MAEGHEHHDRRYAFTVEQRDLRLVLRDDRQERRRTSTTRWSPPAARSLFQAAAAWQAPCGCGWSVGALGCSPRPASWCGGGGPVVAAGGVGECAAGEMWLAAAGRWRARRRAAAA